MKIALCQTTVHKDWHKNLRNAERVIADAVKTKADMVGLPEMFICPYNKKAISAAAQPEGGEAWQAMSEAAAKNHVYLVAGGVTGGGGGRILGGGGGGLSMGFSIKQTVESVDPSSKINSSSIFLV